MNTINWQLFKCRCSAISKMMANKQGFEPPTELQEAKIIELETKAGTEKGLTDKQKEELARLLAKRETSKTIVLSDLCVEYLMEVYAWETQGMIAVNKESLETLGMKKGKMQELQSGALLGFVDDAVYKVHKERISNDYLSGEIDFYLGESVYAATNVTDAKNAFDYPTFLKKINNGLENGQGMQLQGYGCITGAGDLFVANTLVDTPDEIVEEMKWKVAKKFNALTIESPEFLKEWAKWERSMKFEKIPPHQRVHKIKIEPFTEFEQQKVYDKVKICRQWLLEFHERFSKTMTYAS